MTLRALERIAEFVVVERLRVIALVLQRLPSAKDR